MLWSFVLLSVRIFLRVETRIEVRCLRIEESLNAAQRQKTTR
jgi:hypothetical protein